MDDNAAHSLENKTLSSGWFVREKLERDISQTGSNFSVGYIVEKEGRSCFMKAFDFAGFMAMAVPAPGKSSIDVVEVINDMTNAFIYERDLSKLCQGKHVTKVSFVKEFGQEFITGFSITIVPYLIFDLAESDIRKTLSYSVKLDYAWRLKSLHDVAVGLKQLHAIDVAHQDLKPSNILVFKTESKIGDLGRSICHDLDGPYNKQDFSGDWTYAPPEILYGYFEKDLLKRVFATDCYMLGSLIVYYFSGITMNALLRKNIPDSFSWERWTGEFAELAPYLEYGFLKSLSEFESNLIDFEYKGELKKLVEYLCNPFPAKRGHPKSICSGGSNYNMERFVTLLDVLKRKVEIDLKK